MPESVLASVPLPLTGEAVLTPEFRDLDRQAYRITVEGTFHCSITDEQFDALYRGPKSAPFSVRHPLLRWGPAQPLLLTEDRAAHRYTFQVPAAWQGRSASVRLDVDRLVDELLLEPSRVRDSLTGRLTFQTVLIPAAPPFPWAALAAGAGISLGGGAVAWVVRRRMLLAGLDDDLREHLARIEHQCRIAGRDVPPGGRPLLARVREAARTAPHLARAVQECRSIRRTALPAPDQAVETAAADREARMLERLRRVEAVTAEAAALLLTGRHAPDGSAGPGPDPVQRLTAELDALQEVVELRPR